MFNLKNSGKEKNCSKLYFNDKKSPNPNINFKNIKPDQRSYLNYDIIIENTSNKDLNQEILNLEYWLNYFTHYPNYLIPEEQNKFFIPLEFTGIPKKTIKQSFEHYDSCGIDMFRKIKLQKSFGHTSETIVSKSNIFLNDYKSIDSKKFIQDVESTSDSGLSFYQIEQVLEPLNNLYLSPTIPFKNIPIDIVNMVYLKNVPNPDLPFENDFNNKKRKYLNYDVILKGNLNQKQMIEFFNAEFWFNYYKHHSNNFCNSILQNDDLLPKPHQKIKKIDIYNVLQFYVNKNCELKIEQVKDNINSDKLVKINKPNIKYQDSKKLKNSYVRTYENKTISYDVIIETKEALSNQDKETLFNSEYWLNQFTHQSNLLYLTPFNFKTKYPKKVLFNNLNLFPIEIYYKINLLDIKKKTISHKFYPLNYKKPNKLTRIIKKNVSESNKVSKSKTVEKKITKKSKKSTKKSKKSTKKSKKSKKSTKKSKKKKKDNYEDLFSNNVFFNF
jgi:hypothetical protein